MDNFDAALIGGLKAIESLIENMKKDGIDTISIEQLQLYHDDIKALAVNQGVKVDV